MTPLTTQTYRSSFSTLFVWLVPVLVTVESFKVHVVQRVPWAEFSLARNLELIILLALVLSGILVWGLRTVLSSEGLVTFTALGRPVFVPWATITAARVRSLLLLPYLELQIQDGSRVFLSRFLSQQREFDLIVQAITEPRHPLRVCLEELQAQVETETDE